MTDTVTMMGVDIACHSYQTLLEQISDWVAEPGPLQQICTVNPEFFVIAKTQPEFYRVMQQAKCVADGTGIVLGAKLLGEQFPKRVTGSDSLDHIAQRAATEGWRLFLLGAAPGVAEKTAQILTAKYADLQIAGTYAGSPNPDEASDIVRRVNDAHTDILFVAYGAPRQDMWIATYASQLQVRVALGVGGAFDYMAGVVPRAPSAWRRLGLEWLYRLLRQPSRWRRMLRLPVFMWMVLRYRQAPLHET